MVSVVRRIAVAGWTTTRFVPRSLAAGDGPAAITRGRTNEQCSCEQGFFFPFSFPFPRSLSKWGALLVAAWSKDARTPARIEFFDDS